MKKKLLWQVAICTATLLTFGGAVHAQTISTFAGGGGALNDGGQATVAQLTGPIDICIDGSGNKYIIQGTSNHRVRKVTSAGVISTIAGTGTAGTGADGAGAATATVNAPTSIAVDASGNIYFAEGGSNKVRKITVSTGLLSTVAGNGSATGGGAGATGESIQATASSMTPVCVRLDAGENYLYIADAGSHRVRRVALAGGLITTVAGTGTSGTPSEGATATAAQLNTPRGLAFDATGNLYISQLGIDKVSVVKVSDGTISTVAGTGTQGYDGDGIATAKQLADPYYISIDGSGNMLIPEFATHRVRKVNLTTGNMTTIAGSGTASETGDGGLATAATVNAPSSAITDADGNVFICSRGGSKVRVIGVCPSFSLSVPNVNANIGIAAAVTGTGATSYTWSPATGLSATTGASVSFVHTASVTYTITGSTGYCVNTVSATVTTSVPTSKYIWLFAGSGAALGDSGPATAGTILNPVDLCIDAAGNRYVAQNGTGNHRIRKITPAGIMTTVAGVSSPATPATSADGSVATAVQLNAVQSVAVDAAGDVYFAETGSGKIRKLTISTGLLSTVAGGGGATTDGIQATAASMSPNCVRFDASGNLYIVCVSTHRVRKVDMTTGVITTAAGTGISGTSADGLVPTSTNLSTPQGIAFNSSGNMFISQKDNDKVWMIKGDGKMYTVAGSGTGGNNGGYGIATINTLNDPAQIAIDNEGNLIIADLSNNRVRRVFLSTNIMTTLAGTGAASEGVNATAANLSAVNGPTGVAVDADGNIFLCNKAGNYVRVIGNCVIPTVDISGGGTVSEGIATPLAGTSDGTTNLWSPPNGLSSTSSLSVTATVYGTVVYTLTGTSGFCIASATTTLTATPATSEIITLFAGSGGSTGDSGPATAADISTVQDLAYDASGNRYLVQGSPGHRIRKITPGGVITTIAGNGVAANSADGTIATAATVNNVSSVAVDAAGNIYFAEFSGLKVRKINISTGVLSTVAGTGSSTLNAATADNIQATAANIAPFGIRFDASGNLYVTCISTHRVRKINMTTGVVTTVAGTGTAGYLGEGLAATASRLNLPSCVAFDASGNMYISQTGVDRVFQVKASDGKMYTVAGTGTSGNDGNGIATAIRINDVYHIAVDIEDNVLIPDFLNNKVRKLYPSVGMMTTIAGTGTSGETGDGSPATAATLNGPAAVVTDAERNIYICNKVGGRVRYIAAPCITPTVNVTSSFTVCPSTTSTLTATGSSAYSWSPSTGLSATTGASVTVVPTTTTTYTVVGGIGTCTSSATVMVSVYATPATITGTQQICLNLTTTLNCTPSGGVWTSNNANASVSSLGVVTGNIAGTSIITYTNTDGCRSTATVTVNALPTVSAGSGTSICPNANTTLTGTGATSYIWTPSATLSASTGTSVTATPTVATTYTVTGTDDNGCVNTATKTVTILPFSINASSSSDICVGGTSTLTATGGTSYTWTPGASLSATTGASVNASPTITTTYTVTGTDGTCTGTKTVTVTVDAAPVISGTAVVCRNATTTLNGSPGSGAWTSGSGNASVSASGVVTGNTAGLATITYANSSVCFNTIEVTINALPTVSAGSGTNICPNANTTLTGTGATSYTWTPGSSLSATTGTSVTASPSGTTTYTVTGTDGNGCVNTATKTITVLPFSINVSGSGSICAAAGAATLTATGGTSYTWTPGATLSATTGAVITASPTITTTYTVTGTDGTCTEEKMVTVSVSPEPSITGTVNICRNATTTLTASPSGGTWDSNNGNVSVSSLGVVTGNAAGTSIITYTNLSGCPTTTIATINALPTVSAGSTASICPGASTVLNATGATSYTWVPGSSLSATTGTSVTASPASATTYTLTGTDGNGCVNTATKTVSILPFLINASDAGICIGGTATLTATGGTTYTWTPGETLSATTGASVTATPTITTTYTVTGTNGTCTGNKEVTVSVDVAPSITGGTAQICRTTTTTLTGTPAGGNWSSSNSNASVSALGVVTGNTAGAATITYSVSVGCYNTMAVTVNALPTVSAGSGISICPSASTPLTGSGATTYTWMPGSSLSATTGASVTATPTVSTTYTLTGTDGNGCINTAIKTVSITTFTLNAPATVAICPGSSDVLTASGATSYTWAPATGLSATTGASVTASPSVPTTYTVTGTAGTCTQTQTVVVTLGGTLDPITGTDYMCKSGTTTLNCTPTGGTWSSSAPSIASIGSTTGAVYGASGGTAIITYAKSGCFSVKEVTVYVTPAITGVSSVCVGVTVTMNNAVAGGEWTSSDATIATVGSTSGELTGLQEGVVTIGYTPAYGCPVSKQVTVGALSEIESAPWACLNQFTTLTHSVAGGTWSSSNPARATVDEVSGVVYGVSLGNFYITYSLGSGCFRAMEMAVQTFPLTISGSLNICKETSATLTNATNSGTWASSDTTVATITTNSGTMTGVASGTTIITYKFHACINAQQATVNALPADITGADELCTGTPATYVSSPTGGTWSSSNTSRATVDLSSGLVTGVSGGMVTITYSAPVTGCRKTKSVLIKAQPGNLSGTTVICTGGVTTISSSEDGGTWSSSIEAVATVGSTLSWSTSVSGLLPGTTSITATSLGGCARSIVVTVNAAPADITGDDIVCTGRTLQFANVVSGGTWSSSNVSRATVSSTGLVSALSTGTVIITYRTNPTCYISKQITINGVPGVVVGPTSVCVDGIATLNHSELGGTWSSSTPTRATIDETSGQVTGVSAGAVTFTYNINSGCYKTHNMTVNNAPGAIGGTPSVCVGSSTTLINGTSGGTWTSSNTAVASVPSSPGTVTGVSAGIATITYKITATGCMITQDVTVSELPADINGANQLCQNGTELYTSVPTTGGTWASSTTTIGTIGLTSGILTGMAAGTTTITYTSLAGCRKTKVVSVNGLPATITGTLTACPGNNTTLSSATAGLSWSTGDGDIATVGSALSSATIVAAVGTGTVAITATKAGCSRSVVVTVSALPGITGGSLLCLGGTIQLANAAAPSGTWSSSAAGIATVNTSGLISAVAAGTTNISYKTNATCFTVQQVTVGATPAAITGPTGVCINKTVSLAHSITGGSWISSLPSRAIVDIASGEVTGVSAGSVTITYNTAPGCFRTFAMVVNSSPAAIYGADRVCVGATTKLTDGTTGGTWSSSSTGTASIAPTGVVTGVTDGTATITYKLTATGCLITREIIVDSLPTTISEAGHICRGSTETYTSMPVGGTWLSNATTKATIGSTSGMATGVAVGTALLTYTAPVTGCRTTKQISVYPVPAAITGITTVCAGNSVTLSNVTAGQTWSSTLDVATVSSLTATTAMLTGLTPGITTISYTNWYGCASKIVVTVNDAVPDITGDLTVCPSRTVQLNNTASSGVWQSALATKATVNSSGLVTGVNAGTVNITFGVSSGCYKVAMVTVNPVPSAITGPTSVCAGDSIDLNHVTVGGTWGSLNSFVIVNPINGFVTGVSSGTALVTYAINSGCFVTSPVTIKAQPSAIDGEPFVAVGTTVELTNTTTGGTWSSSNTDIASIGATSGLMMGLVGGSTTITYRVTATSCYVTANGYVSGGVARPAAMNEMKNIHIYPNPTQGLITVDAAAQGTFTLYTLDGKEVRQYHTEAPSTSVSLPNNLAAGVYMCRFQGVDGSSQLVRIVYAP